MLIDGPELQQLADEVADMAGESREEAVRRALVERRERLAAARRPDRLTPEEIATKLAALRELQRSMALTPEQADAWIAEVRAERMAHRVPGVVYPEDDA